MEDFYKKWLLNFSDRRKSYFNIDNQTGGSDSENSESEIDKDVEKPKALSNPTDIVYENENYRLIVEKSSFKKQKNFRLLDHLFKFKLEQKQTLTHPPLLTDLFDFFHAALLHILESIKTFYKKEDHNIAYLTLHQEPMVNGLNTGKILLLC